MWPKKKKPTRPAPNVADLAEARTMREEANAELVKVRIQDQYVNRLTGRLLERRALDAFGNDVQITFTRRHA